MPASPQTADSRAAWIRLLVSLIIAAVANVGIWAVVVIMPAVEAEFGSDRAGTSLTYTATMIGFAVGNLVIGRIVDKHGMATALLGAGVLMAAGYVCATFTGSIAGLAIAQLFIGLATASGFGPLIADISRWFSRRRGIAVAVVASGNYVAGAFWPMLLAGVLTDHGWRAVYLALAIASVLIIVPLSFLLRPQPSQAEQEEATASAGRRVAASPFSPRTLQIMLALAGVACCMAMSMPQVHLVALCTDLGFGAAVGAEMLSLMLVGGVVSRLASGFVADRLGGVRTVLIGSALQGIALALYLPAEGMATLYWVSLIFGLSQGGIVPSYAVIVREYMPADEAGTRIGAIIMATIFGMAGGGWMSGWIFDVTGSYQMAFLNGIAWNVLNIAIMLMILARTGRRVAA